MRWLDFAKSAGIAALVLIIDRFAVFVVVGAWATFIESGHPRSYYQTAVIPIALWSTRIFGTALVFGSAWLSAKRNPERNTILFSTSLVVFYALFDRATVGFANFFTISVAVTISLNLVAALAGGLIGLRLRPVVSAESSPKANSMDVFRSVWYRLVLLFCVVTAAESWFVVGPSNPACAMVVVGTTFCLGPAVAAPVMRRVPRQWLRVPRGERVLHRIVGVGIFGWLLDISGWNRLLAEPMRGFSGKRDGLPSLEQSVRGGAIAHGTCFAIHVLLAVLALFTRHPWSGALWMLLPGVVVHLYPVLLQRSIMLRLQPVLAKTGSC
jgi:Glycosyl-4,4'-diaponeurosporenoate acyltransferase